MDVNLLRRSLSAERSRIENNERGHGILLCRLPRNVPHFRRPCGHYGRNELSRNALPSVCPYPLWVSAAWSLKASEMMAWYQARLSA